MALARRLGARGIEVVSVASGADALRKLQETRPDVIFMDYMMPEMDGLEACRAIVNNTATSQVPVIMTTSNDTPEFRRRGVASGASGFLSKGLEDRELDNVLDAVSGIKLEQTMGGDMVGGKVEIDDETLAWIRDQAINAARQASEEYFTGQLQALEDQVVSVAENAAKQVLGDASPVRGIGGGSGVGDVRALEQRLENLHTDKQLRAMINQLIKDSAGGYRADNKVGGSSSSGSGIGRFFKNLLLIMVLLVVIYFGLTMFFAELPFVVQLQETVVRLIEQLQKR